MEGIIAAVIVGLFGIVGTWIGVRDRQARAAAKSRIAALEQEKADLQRRHAEAVGDLQQRVADLQAENRELSAALALHRADYRLDDGDFSGGLVTGF